MLNLFIIIVETYNNEKWYGLKDCFDNNYNHITCSKKQIQELQLLLNQARDVEPEQARYIIRDFLIGKIEEVINF